ncbi:hypothetical protein ZOSMA_117G00750 [Zostera marina]|uniref:Uncharacterized protein n=1 Tax=Zostera marina TaxID=29655 RepID=A0A0K9Q425_ZOSMR|nr:hypothetical protein ZOSMA_117G00750 [Zostera marina]
MASTLVNNISLTPEPFSPSVFSSFSWLTPRVSLGRDEEKSPRKSSTASVAEESPTKDDEDGDSSSGLDFEFRLHDPVTMITADELFSNGKLVPLHVTSTHANKTAAASDLGSVGFRPLDLPKKTNKSEFATSIDPHVLSPRAPRCSSRWRDLLGLKKAALAAKPDQNPPKQSSASISSVSTPTRNPNASTRGGGGGGGGLKYFLNRGHKASSESSYINRSLPRGGESESVSISARLSLSSSSSSGRDHEELPRLSLDSDRSRNPTRLRISKVQQQQQRQVQGGGCKSKSRVMIPVNNASVESPRMNSYGKIVFQGLERSSSSPSTFNGGPRAKHRGVERSYSANVRVTPVLNVPVCSLRGSAKNVFGFGQLFSPQQKKDGNVTGRAGGGRGHRQMK